MLRRSLDNGRNLVLGRVQEQVVSNGRSRELAVAATGRQKSPKEQLAPALSMRTLLAVSIERSRISLAAPCSLLEVSLPVFKGEFDAW